MICRNCSAEIDANNEKCPFCHKDPRKRNSHGKVAYIICALVIIIAAAAVFVWLNFDEVKSHIAMIFPEITVASSTAPTTAVTEATSSTTAQSESSSSAQIEAYGLSTAEIKEFAVFSKDEKEVSKRGLITAKKEEVKALSQAQFGDFCLQKVSRSPYSWLTVRFEDSTGIVFTGNCVTCAVYCTLDKNDYIKNVIGLILLSGNGTYVYAENEKDESSTEPSTQKGTEVASAATETTEVSSTSAESKVAVEEKTDVTINKSAQSRATKPEATMQTTAAPKAEEEDVDNDNSSTVYITNTGTKYHRAGCSSLSKSKKAISVNEAKRNGYEACKRCKP